MTPSPTQLHCVLVGNYGVSNIGDEALSEYFLTELRDVAWTVVTASPTQEHDVPRLPLGFRSLFARWVKTIVAIRNADALVFGGGSLFTDVESVWACVVWRAYAVVARFFGTPVFLAFQGVGPFRTRFGLRLARKTFEEASYVSVRDGVSLERLRSFRLPRDPVLTFDPAFALFSSRERRPVGRRLVIIPRTNSGEKFFREVSAKLSQGFTDVRILLMQPSLAERELGERLRELAGPPSSVIDLTTVSALLDEVSAASEVVTQRYHGALAALAMDIPVEIIPQAEGDKLSSLQTLVGTSSVREDLLGLVKKGSESLRVAMRGVSSL